MIDVREADVLVREVAQVIDRRFNVDPALTDGGEKFAQALFFDVRPPGYNFGLSV